MASAKSVGDLIALHGEALHLAWLGDPGAAANPLDISEPDTHTSPVGHLNFIRSHRVVIAGHDELTYLASLDPGVIEETLTHLSRRTTAAIIVADGLSPPPLLIGHANRLGIALLGSNLDGPTLVDHLQHYLLEMLGETVVLHGVFMEVAGLGVLITGDSGIGKSELALELINRGHRLVADDAPLFRRIAPTTIVGRAPDPLADFLEVRGLGILNIRAMYGDSAIKRSKYLKLIIHLQLMDDVAMSEIDRLHGSRRHRPLLGVTIPEVIIPVAPARNLAVLVEAAARHQILQDNGYDAAADLIARQSREMKK